ncbi:MAG TPA: choice-of-anchor Q domain-containing protein [Rhodanobacteraceae bacterium]|nr:choice-of-anchor Q domain-containing protein [Rhodanobacteraceae bacterium]
MVLRKGVLAGLLASAALPAQADVFCVGSEASAQAAIDTARTNGQADYIKLEAGVYSLTTGLQYSTGGSSDHEILILSGGFDAGCNDRTGTTILDGQDTVRPLSLQLFDSDLVFVDHLTLIRGYATGSPYGGNMEVDLFDQSGASEARLDYMRFVLGKADANSGGLYVTGWGKFQLRNSLIAYNEAPSSPAGSVNLHGEAWLVSNTIAKNLDNDATEGFAYYMNGQDNGSHFWLSNNVLWGNENTGLDLYMLETGTTYDLIDNDIGAMTDTELGPASGGNISVDPLFGSCGFLCFDLPLTRASPLVDAGTDTPPGDLTFYDLFGQDRIIGPHTDIGAYELETIFADGFEDNGIF